MSRTHSRSLHFAIVTLITLFCRHLLVPMSPKLVWIQRKSSPSQFGCLKICPVYLRCHRMSQINASSCEGPELTSTQLFVIGLPKFVWNVSQLPQPVSTRLNHAQHALISPSRVDRNWCHSVPTSNRKCNYELKGLLVIRLAIALGEWTLWFLPI